MTETDASECKMEECGHNCDACSLEPWNCTSCSDGSTPVNNSCGCPEGYSFALETAADPCIPDDECHYTCGTCFGNGDPNSCLSCKANASLRFDDDRPTFCDCDEGYYPSWTTENCVQIYPDSCSTNCAHCLADDPNYCISCKAGAELSEDVQQAGVCVCKEGYHPEPDAGHC